MTVKLLKPLWTEEFNYYSEKSVDKLKTDIQIFFDKNHSVNLTGEFISEYEFAMIPKWQLVYIKSFERELSFLNGQIFSNEFENTQVTFTVRPNSIFVIFFFIFLIVGILLLTNDNIKGNANDVRMVGMIFAFVVPAVMLFFGHFAKQLIKDRFIQTFGLKAIK